MIRLLLADDQPIFRQGLATLLSLEEDLIVVGEANHGEEAIALTETLQPDIILMDVRMPICDGVQATQAIHTRYPWIRILVLTTFDNDEYVFKSLQSGALGYLLKSTPAPKVAAAIRSLNQGYSQLGPTIAPKVFSQLNNAPADPKSTDYDIQFNRRELEILKLLGQGKSNREIAAALNLTEGTIKNHLTNIFCQLDVRDRTQAALWAHQYLG
ncbi:response regulator containing a -like receiver domain protein and an hth dna-binding domain protein [Leptolyngbya sp. Heron Island J]|uniref:response regulator n=1 Tax=Leptolyngbya sp. Heron Island J TaxID=1385935 RepID=UPI0003B9F527|nr:response regulator transcription factor [Leptolyngbya sp. Heron Island J]ESA38596.1 response regulator containing a -like receiver domain protein and an hth dna-binding domain protein [Leptolyngbya sp. Heron Island J]